MNQLLTDNWIPIHQSGSQKKISLQDLLCSDIEGELCLSRDDMELACLQLLVALVQVLFPVEDKIAHHEKLNAPMSRQEYIDACEGKFEWFDLTHPKTPFMQFRGVTSEKSTEMKKLLAGVADGTSKVFVNPYGLGLGLCSSCTAIALYNIAYNCPGMGGGFKESMRGRIPITIFIKDNKNRLRETVWHNVLTEQTLREHMPWYDTTIKQEPNYVKKLKANDKIHANTIGLVQGLFWQPAHFELLPDRKQGNCSCCGETSMLFTGFNKEKFKYTLEGIWPHPLSSKIFSVKKGEKEEKFPSFTTEQPTWIHLAKLITDIISEKDGYQAAPIIYQQKLFRTKNIQIIVGGYRSNKATITERRHELFSLADGWGNNDRLINEIIGRAQEYKKSLRTALYIFCNGVKDKFAGTGIDLTAKYDAIFYQQTEKLMHDIFAEIKFDNPKSHKDALYKNLESKVLALFEQATASYRHEPKMLKALAEAKSRLIHKYLKELKTIDN